MTFSHYAGVAIVPTLARIVLAAAFISAGWNKVFRQAEFTADQATRLKQLGVDTDPVTPIVKATISSPGDALGSQSEAGVMLAAFHPAPAQDPASTPQADPAEVPPVSSDVAPPAVPAEEQTQPPTSPAAPSTTAQPLPPGMYRAASMHHVTLLLDANNFPQPLWMARLAAFTELLGGAMLLIGLFSRLWGLGLAIAMGVAFYLTSMKANGIFRMDPRDFALNIEHFNTAYCQAGLFVLAFGVFLTGAGPLSIDRILFGGPRHPDEVEVKID